MSETLKFGNGEWATKEGSTLAYNSENGNFKPLPFTFDRSTSATRVNKQGLIEVVSNNEPRIDFLNDSKGALLLEPSRSNLITYSEDFSNAYYNTGSTIISSNAITSPEGVLNADKVTEDATNGKHYKRRLFNVSGEFTLSIFVKKEERDKIWLGNVSTLQYSIFDLTNESSTNSGTTSSKIENYGNGWYRCTVVDTLNQSVFLSFGLVDDNNNIDYQGDGTSGLYAWGFQYEANSSYATSLIPTQGSIGTRVAESCSQTPPSGIIGQTEGTLFMQVGKTETPQSVLQLFGIDNGTSSQRIEIGVNTSNQIFIYVENASDSFIQLDIGTLIDNSKIAVAYKANQWAVYLNGISIYTNTSANYVPTCSALRIAGRYDNAGIEKVNVKNTSIYNTRLTDQELINLTTI